MIEQSHSTAISITIHIDKHEYVVHSQVMTGEQLRSVPHPPIAADRDLWLEVPGGTDVEIKLNQSYDVKDGMHFFTAPSTINPGR